jgi:hypothetical protein
VGRVPYPAATPHTKAHRIFEDTILPLARDPTYASLPAKTSFVFTEEDILTNILAKVDQKCPQLHRDPELFLATVRSIVFGKG